MTRVNTKLLAAVGLFAGAMLSSGCGSALKRVCLKQGSCDDYCHSEPADCDKTCSEGNLTACASRGFQLLRSAQTRDAGVQLLTATCDKGGGDACGVLVSDGLSSKAMTAEQLQPLMDKACLGGEGDLCFPAAMHAALTNQDEQAAKFAQLGCAAPSKRGGFKMNESCALQVCLGTKPSSPTDRTYACQRQDVRYRTDWVRYASGPGSVLDKLAAGQRDEEMFKAIRGVPDGARWYCADSSRTTSNGSTITTNTLTGCFRDPAQCRAAAGVSCGEGAGRVVCAAREKGGYICAGEIGLCQKAAHVGQCFEVGSSGWVGR